MENYEKLGAFYLGKTYDTDRSEIRDELLLYDSKDLTTHAVCVGMTGSGKTGLCLSLLEEAAIDGIPTLAIDPKGDLANLLLTFPNLAPGDFRPWIDEAEAARKGSTPDEYATRISQLWKKGLGGWGQDGSRISRFQQAVDLPIYTPGSSAGLPISLLRSFAAPPSSLREDTEAFRERIASAVSGLLGLMGIKADPLQSREHILLSNIFLHAWGDGRDLDVAKLIHELQDPPFDRVGVMDLDSFFPAADRFALSMRLNNLLASPGFSTWLEGEPLDIPRLLWTPEGKPRVSILSIAHLSEEERMFFVTLLLNEVLAWVRTQPGTSSLRALLYMDEVFGFFPPTANPPSKKPMLTLLKQARAFGLGVVLTTQNPVDLDYKGLSNTGTWFLGRLQTERDKLRVLEGLEGVSAASGSSFDRKRADQILSGLKSRVFLMHNVHEDAPVLFHTRWALSYLRGPLTRTQIQTLMAERKKTGETAPTQPRPPSTPAEQPAKSVALDRPLTPPEVPERFLPVHSPPPQTDRVLYRPALSARARLHFVRARTELDHWEEQTFLAPVGAELPPDPWAEAEPVEMAPPDLDREPISGAGFAEAPSALHKSKNYTKWEKKLRSHLYRTQALTLWKSRELRVQSAPEESEGEFRVRLAQKFREKRDLTVAKLEKRYKPKLARVQERIRKAEARVEKEQSQYKQQKLQTAVSLGATVLGALFGRKTFSTSTVGRASTTARGVGRASREKGDVARALQDLEAHQRKLLELEEEFQAEIEELETPIESEALELEEIRIRPRKSDISVSPVALTWVPWFVDADGLARPASE